MLRRNKKQKQHKEGWKNLKEDERRISNMVINCIYFSVCICVLYAKRNAKINRKLKRR